MGICASKLKGEVSHAELVDLSFVRLVICRPYLRCYENTGVYIYIYIYIYVFVSFSLALA